MSGQHYLGRHESGDLSLCYKICMDIKMLVLACK